MLLTGHCRLLYTPTVLKTGRCSLFTVMLYIKAPKFVSVSFFFFFFKCQIHLVTLYLQKVNLFLSDLAKEKKNCKKNNFKENQYDLLSFSKFCILVHNANIIVYSMYCSRDKEKK